FVINDVIAAGNQIQPAVAGSVLNSTFLGAWTTPGPNVEEAFGLAYQYSPFPVGHEQAVNGLSADHASDPSVANLVNDAFIVTYTDTASDPGGNIRGPMYLT